MSDQYGINEHNGMSHWEQVERFGEIQDTVHWDDPRLAKILRFRLLSDPGFPAWDVSYCTGQLKDGTTVRVTLPFSQLDKPHWKADLLDWAKQDKVLLRD